MLFYVSVLLYVVISPFIFLYGLLLCPTAWIEWGRQGKDLLVVDTDSAHSKEWMLRILPIVGERAVFLDYGKRDQWERWSLAVQLFGIFGPHGIPERFTPYSLPAVILFEKLHRPKTFTFGERSKNREAKLEQLRSKLGMG
jgi:hypothetical protein